MKASSMEPHRSALLALRAGALPFDALVAEVRPTLEARATRFVRVWGWCGQSSVDVEDLVQEMTLALWRGVDQWDPERADLIRYVDHQIGRAAQRRMRQVAGYPDPRRSAPARQVSSEAMEHVVGALPVETDFERVLEARERAELVEGQLVGLERLVVRMALRGHSLEEMTERIYREHRLAFEMDSEVHARRLIGVAVRRATKVAISVATEQGD